jgi:hypothetical protein
VLLRPSALPRGVGPGFVSTSSTLMSELRNQLASANLKTHQKLINIKERHSSSRTYPAGPAPMMRMSTSVMAVILVLQIAENRI